MVAAAAAAVTSEAFCVRPPTARTTAVCEVPPPAGIAPNKAPRQIRGAGRHQLPVGGDRGVARRRKRPPGGDRFGKAHQGDAQRPGQQLPHQVEARQRQRGQRLRNGARRLRRPTSAGRKTTKPRSRPPTTNSGADECGFSRSSHQQGDQRRGGNRDRDQRRLGHVLRQAGDVPEEAPAW